MLCYSRTYFDLVFVARQQMIVAAFWPHLCARLFGDCHGDTKDGELDGSSTVAQPSNVLFHHIETEFVTGLN